MSEKTRYRIIQKAVELFNERGFYDVRIRDISTALDISPGSISYHFRSKEDLMESIYRYMLHSLDKASLEERLYIKEGHELILPTIYLDYMTRFRFFFKDTLDIIRTYPKIGDHYRQHVQMEIQVIENMISYGVEEQVFIAEQFEHQYHRLANSIWQTVHFWFARNAILGYEEDQMTVVQYVAGMLYPYCTREGRYGENNIYRVLGVQEPVQTD